MTRTTSWRANEVPSYQGVPPDPPMKAPPWIHTMTGRLPSSHAGVHTLSDRQSSSVVGGMPPNRVSRGDGFCMATGPNSTQSRTPSHGGAGWGGRNRSSPTGGAAKGMPLKTSTPSTTLPCTLPAAVSTIVMGVSSLPAEKVTCDVGDLDLVGPGVDLQDLGVAGQLLDLVLGHVAVAAEQLHGLERHLDGRV